MDNESSCTTVLISDDPSETDSFGSHGRVAKAIAQLINKEDGGKSIALTGSWGSGKSTVVELMKNNLDDGTEVFVFDAWAHEGDPLRRTFLEQLIDFLIMEEWIDEKCADIKKKLSGKSKTETVDSTPVLTDAGKIFGVATLLVPLGLAILSWTPNMVEQLPLIGALSFAGATLTISPLLSLLYFQLWNSYGTSNEIHDECITKKDESKNKKKEDLLVFINQHREITKSKSIKTPDPTSLEFQYYFRKLLKSALGDNKHKLLIVIDNLDRIDAEDALEIWATMRTFFEFDSNNDAKWKSYLWLLVPFDKDALTRLWHIDDEQNVNGDKQNGGEQSPSEQLVQSFIDKSFQITFNVASPIYTSWKDFLFEQLKKAFPKHGHDEFHTIYRLYRLHRTPDNRFPTPRDLKLFVNNIGALHRQWQEEIPLPIQALYVILQRKGNSNFENELREDKLAIDKELHLIDSKNYKKYLAALHFNVLVKDSLQVLMPPRIKTALRAGDIADMNKMCELEGFAQICGIVLDDNCQDWSEEDGKYIGIAANTISKIEQNDDHSWLSMWDLLCSNTKQISVFGDFDENIGNGLVQLLNHQQDDDFAKSIIILICESVSLLGDNDPPIDSASLDNWLKGIFAVYMGLHNTRHKNTLCEHFCIDCSASAYIEIISHLNKNSEWDVMHPYFKKKTKLDEVTTILAEKVGEEKFSDYMKCVPTMLQTKQEWQWKNLIPALIEQLQGSNNITPAEIYANLYTLLYLEKKEVPLDQTWNDLTTEGNLFHQIYGANDDAKIISLCLVPILQKNPKGNPQYRIGNPYVGLDMYKAIMKSPTSRSEIVTNFAQHVIELSTLEPYLELPIKAQNTSEFIYAAMEVIAEEKPLAEMLTDYGFNINASRIYSIALKKIDENYEQEFAEFLIDGFKGIEKNTWYKELRNGGHTLQLLIDIVDKKYQPKLNIEFQDALINHAEHLIKNNAELQHLKDEWDNVYNALASHTKNTFLKHLLDMVIRSKDNTDKILDLYGELLVDCDILNNDADDLVFVGFKNFIKKMSIAELKWMKNVISDCPTILTACEPQSKMDFEDRITDALNNDELSDEIQELLSPITNQLGLDIPQNYGES